MLRTMTDTNETARSRRVVIALGGNALASGDAAPEAQAGAVARSMVTVADLVAGGDDVVITHGNGPQVGDLMLRNELARGTLPEIPLDWCVAETQAMIGYLITTALEAELAARDLPLSVVPILTRILVDPDDPAWRDPSKPVGPYLSEEDARAKSADGDQHWREVEGKGWRRVVASPEPKALLDGQTIALVLGTGSVVVANGGGGIPMVREEDGCLRGVEAVVDKDLAGVLLAEAVDADRFAILTDVPAVLVDRGTPDERPVHRTTVAELRAFAAAGQFPAGSMGPKVEAVCRFVERTGGRGAIGALEEIEAVVAGTSGTQVHPG
jgi:carbamate kinase